MKKKIIALMLCLISILISNLKAQDITEVWNGVLEVMGTQLALVFHIHETDSGFTANFDSPDQGALGIPFTTVEFNNDSRYVNKPDSGTSSDKLIQQSPKYKPLNHLWFRGFFMLSNTVKGRRVRSQAEAIA